MKVTHQIELRREELEAELEVRATLGMDAILDYAILLARQLGIGEGDSTAGPYLLIISCLTAIMQHTKMVTPVGLGIVANAVLAAPDFEGAFNDALGRIARSSMEGGDAAHSTSRH